jgi:hypothetical protein
MSTQQTPVQWLIEQFESACLDQRAQPEPARSVVIQPMYQLKSATDAGHPMSLTQADYRQPWRWWL